MPNIIDILARAQSLMNETALNSITPPRAGGIMYDTLLVLNQMQLEGASLLISKVYASVSAMEADTTPTSDLTGRALKPGQLVVIVTSDTSSSDMGSEYRYNGPGSWTYVGKVGGLPLDTAPTQDSTKGITSGAVYTAIAAMKAEGYKYMGLATPGSGGTAPGTPSQPVFYIAGPGSYPNFGSITVSSGYLGFLKYSGGSWSVESVAVGKDYDEQISQLRQDLTDLRKDTNEYVQDSVYENSYVQPVVYELGNIGIVVSTNTWTYSDSTTRVRTPEEYVLHLFPGDTIGLSSYSDTRFYIGWRKPDGSTGGANGWRTSDYTVTEEGYYCILVCNSVDTVQTSADALGSLIVVVRNSPISKRISDLKSTQNGISVLPDSAFTLSQDDAYINYVGDVVNSTSFKILSYSAKKGDYIYLKANNSTYVSCISKDGTGTPKNSLLVGHGDDEYRYIVQEDATIYISINKIAANKLVIVRNSQFASLLDIDGIPYTNVNGISSVLRNKYIKYSDGSINDTGSPIRVYSIPAEGVKKVRAYVSGNDNIGAAIAFYSSETISTETYISGVQMVGNKGGGRWYEADVPNTAVLICFTNHMSDVANPYIAVDSVSPKLLGTEEKEVPELGVGIVYGYQKAANYDGTFSPLYTNNSYFPIESFQSRIRLTPLYGIRLNIKQACVLTIVKATGVLTENCVMTTIKAFTTTKTGWQVLLFDAPVTLSEGESLGVGVKTDTAKVVVDSVYGGANAVMTNYLHYTQNIWTVYQQNLLIDVLGIPKNDAEEALARVTSLEKRDAFAGNNPFRFNGPFYAHMFLDKIYETSTDITVPSESLDDIRVSRRLGFNVIEANVQTTSDGKFIVIHGSGGKFGYEVTDLNGDFTYADTAINSVTLDWIKANIRYRSDIPRFRTAIPTFEEFLRECRLQGMIPFAQASTAAMVALLDGIMGYGNYFAYNGVRSLTKAPIVEYLSLTTKEAILEHARSKGVPYVYAMANYNTFTDDELKDIVSSLHSEGFMIATAYVSATNADRVRKLGFDMIASSWNVNNFDNANLCTLCVGADWSDFQITGSSATDAGVELGAGQRITPKNALGVEFLAKGMLQVTFSGTVYLRCGKDEQEVTSDGINSVIFSSYFINTAPTFDIVGQSAGAVITDVVFKASKC